jgi:hypothetical protein
MNRTNYLCPALYKSLAFTAGCFLTAGGNAEKLVAEMYFDNSLSQ